MVPQSARPGIRAAALILLTSIGLIAEGARSQSIPVARAVASGYSLWTVDEVSGTATVSLTGLSFETVALMGYSAQERLRADLPQVLGVGSAAPLVSLPQGGSLYRVRQGSVCSWLHLRVDGTHAIALSATGLPGLLPQISISRDGSRALAASDLAAGGEVFLLDLSGGAAPVSLSSGLGPLNVDGISLRVSAGHAWFVAAGLLYRADLVAGGGAAVVSLSVAPGALLLPELAVSGDGASAAMVVQSPLPGARHVFVVDAAGVGRQVTVAEANYDTPDLAHALGPRLALSPDGSLVAYRCTVPTAELFVRRTDLGAAAEQVTANVNFVDTIDNVGVIGFADLDTVTFVAGEIVPLEPAKLGAADVYQASFAGGAATLQNISRSSGLASPPFVLPGELEILDAATDPLGERLLLTVDPVGGDSALVSVPLDGSVGVTTLLPTLFETPVLTAAGERVLLTSKLDTGMLPPLPTRLHLLHPVAAPAGLQLLGTAPAGWTLDRFAVDDAASTAALAVGAGAGLELALLVDLASGTLALAWNQPFGLSPQLAFAPSGRLVTGLGFAGGPFLFAAFSAPQVGQALPIPLSGGFPLQR